MRLITKLSILIIVLTTASCAPYMNSVWEKPDYTPRKFKTVMVIALMKNLEARKSFEGNIIQQLKVNHGDINYVTGLEMLPPDIPEDKVTDDYINNFIKEHNIDAVIATSLVNTYLSNDLVANNAYYSPYFYGPSSYIYGYWGMMYQPNYYVTSQNFVLQSSIFDLEAGDDTKTSLIWKGEYSVTDPYTISDGAYEYARNLVKYIDRNYYLSKK